MRLIGARFAPFELRSALFHVCMRIDVDIGLVLGVGILTNVRESSRSGAASRAINDWRRTDRVVAPSRSRPFALKAWLG